MAGMQIAGLAGDGGDPRMSVSSARINGQIRPQERGLYDLGVTFEEYHYYALKTRAEEENRADGVKTRVRDLLIPNMGRKTAEEVQIVDNEKRRGSTMAEGVNLSNKEKRAVVTDQEWRNASRALRTASGAACFYLITTDILGPFGIGFAIGTMGWIQGIILFTIFGAAAGL